MDTGKHQADAPQEPQQANQDGWTLVTRRRRPPHFLPSPLSPPRQARTLVPHPPTYAQILQQKPPSPAKLPMTQPPNQPTITNPTAGRSPHSPHALPYPPNPYQKEWWGRCFRCARKGHVIAECTFPRLTPPLPEAAPPLVSTPAAAPLMAPTPTAASLVPSPPIVPTRRLTTSEPGFDDLLTGPEPQSHASMPADRPQKITCYLNRDQHYLDSLGCSKEL